MQNIRKGELARTKVRGKRCLELGSGMGLAGMALAMIGCDVLLTDTADVMPLLRINVDNNLSAACVRLAKGARHGITCMRSWLCMHAKACHVGEPCDPDG